MFSGNTKMMCLYSLLAKPHRFAQCFAPCCVTHNARGAIFTDSLTSKLADSLCVDYLAQVTTRRLSMTVVVADAVEEASK